MTRTNAVDHREFYAFHQGAAAPQVSWRVRAARNLDGKLSSGLPAVAYGPWSPEYTTPNPGSSTARSRRSPGQTRRTDGSRDHDDKAPVDPRLRLHREGPAGRNGTAELYRVYIFSDSALRQCDPPRLVRRPALRTCPGPPGRCANPATVAVIKRRPNALGPAQGRRRSRLHVRHRRRRDQRVDARPANPAGEPPTGGDAPPAGQPAARSLPNEERTDEYPCRRLPRRRTTPRCPRRRSSSRSAPGRPLGQRARRTAAATTGRDPGPAESPPGARRRSSAVASSRVGGGALRGGGAWAASSRRLSSSDRHRPRRPARSLTVSTVATHQHDSTTRRRGDRARHRREGREPNPASLHYWDLELAAGRLRRRPRAVGSAREACRRLPGRPRRSSRASRPGAGWTTATRSRPSTARRSSPGSPRSARRRTRCSGSRRGSPRRATDPRAARSE